MNVLVLLFTIIVGTVGDFFVPVSAAAFHRSRTSDSNRHKEKLTYEHDAPSVTTYDQRQSGKYNIHLNIKDVEIIAIDEGNLEGSLGDDTIYDYGDYDYDPAHLTVSPLPIFGAGSIATSRPTKSTTKLPVVLITTSSSPPKNKTKIPQSTTPSVPSDQGHSTVPTNATEASTPKQPIEMYSTDTTLGPNAASSPLFVQNHITTDKIEATTKNSFTTMKKPTPYPGHYNFQQDIPVQIIVEPYRRQKQRSEKTAQPPTNLGGNSSGSN